MRRSSGSERRTPHLNVCACARTGLGLPALREGARRALQLLSRLLRGALGPQALWSFILACVEQAQIQSPWRRGAMMAYHVAPGHTDCALTQGGVSPIERGDVDLSLIDPPFPLSGRFVCVPPRTDVALRRLVASPLGLTFARARAGK